uniref:Si:dkey-261l7.2 n=1 Tax=Oryzias latipes TaxID=8090 RepID=A0A3P9LL34_ORYLA
MPQLSPAAALQIALLLSAVPAQYYLCRWSGSTAARRYHATSRLLRIWKEWRSSYLNGSAWMDWTSEQVSRFRSLVGSEQEDQESAASPPMESMLIDNDQGFFGASKVVRSPRPPYVFLRVGEVVMERKGHMVGVVVSWDPELRAPPEWTDRMFSDSQGMTVEKTPHYKVLFGGPGPSSLMVAYLPQTQLERVTGMKPDIPTLENYFTHYDGTRFVMQPWLRALFPEDESED